MAAATFGNLVKAVVDIDREIIAVNVELHSDLEVLLLENGSRQKTFGVSIFIRKFKEMILLSLILWLICVRPRVIEAVA